MTSVGQLKTQLSALHDKMQEALKNGSIIPPMIFSDIVTADKAVLQSLGDIKVSLKAVQELKMQFNQLNSSMQLESEAQASAITLALQAIEAFQEDLLRMPVNDKTPLNKIVVHETDTGGR